MIVGRSDFKIRTIDRSKQSKHVDEDGQADEAVDNGGDARKVRNEEFKPSMDHAKVAIFRLVFLKKNGCCDSQRHRDDGAGDTDPDGSAQSEKNARFLWIRGRHG